MKRNLSNTSQSGVTLIELTVVAVVLAVVASLGAPSLSRTVAGYRQRAAVQSMLAAFHFARVEAVARGQSVTLCPVAATREDCGTDYRVGWKVFVDPDRDQRLYGDEKLLRSFPPIPDTLVVSNRAGTRAPHEPVTWYPDGTAHRNLTLQVCAAGGRGRDAFSVVLNLIGRPRVARGVGLCPGEAA